MSRRRKNNFIIGVLITIVLIMAVGFAAFSSSLTINGTSNIDSKWNVEITSIQADKTATKTGDVYTSPGTINESIGTDKLSAQFSAALISPGDTVTYTMVVENKGTLNAVLSTINNTNSENEYIIFRIEGIKQGDILNAGQTQTFRVITKYKNISEGQGQPDNTIGDFGLSLDFVQTNNEGIPATSTAQETLDYSFSKTTKSITLTANNSLNNVDYYEYYIDGTWSADSNNTHVFDNLSSGTHTVNVKAVKENGEEITSQEKQVTLDDIEIPSFKAVYNSADDVDVTINYPEGCGSTLTCTYNKNYTRGVETVTSTSETVNFIDDGYVIASVTDGTNTVSSTYTVTIGDIIPSTSTSSDGLTPNGYTASSTGTGTTPNIVMGKLFYSVVDTTNSITLTVNESLLNLSNGYSYAYCIDEDCTNDNWSNDSSNVHEFTNLSPGTHTVNVKVITDHGKEYIGTSREVTLKTVKIPSFKAVYNYADDVDVTVYYPEGCGNELECSYDIYRIYNYGTDSSYEQYETSNPVYSRTETIKFYDDGYIVARINDGSREVSSTYTLIMPNLATSTSTSTASASATGDLTPNGFIATSSGTGTGPNIAMGKLFYSAASTTNSIRMTVNESLLNLYNNLQYYYCIDEGCTNNEWQQEWSNTYEFTNLSPGTHTVNVKVITYGGKEYIGASREVTVKDIEVPSFKAVYNYTDDVDVTVYYPEGCGNQLECSYDIYKINYYGTNHSYESHETSNSVYSRTETIKFYDDGYIIARISDGSREVSSTYTVIMPNLATSTGSSSGSASGQEWIPASSGHVATSSGTGTGPYISLGKLLYSVSNTTNSITLTVNTEALNMNHGYEFYYVIDEGTDSVRSTDSSDNVYTFEGLSGGTHTVNVRVHTDSGRAYIGTPQTVTLSTIDKPTFRITNNIDNTADVTINYPASCAGAATSSATASADGTCYSYRYMVYDENDNQIEDYTMYNWDSEYNNVKTINVAQNGYVVAEVYDGTYTISSTILIDLGQLASASGTEGGQGMHAIFTDENIENGVRTTITYPSGCGDTLTCTYKKNNDEIVNVYDDTAYVEFEEEGYVITTVSDGTDTVTDRHNVKEFIKIDASDTTTTSTITLTVYPVESNSQSEITKYEFSIDDGETWIDNGNNNAYRFEGLNHATSYNLKVRVTSNFGTTVTKEFYTVTNSINRPTFSVQYNDVNDVDVTIRYPDDYNGNGFTYTYEKDSESPVTATKTQKVKFTEDGELVASVTDGTNTVSATYTVTMPEKKNFNGVDILVVNGGNGLYDNGNDSYIYKGSPNNYIQIGSDTYRIMEFTSDGQIKVVRDTSIATLPWDAGYSNNISGVTSSSSITGTRYSSNSSDFCYNSSASSYYGCKAWGSNTSTLNSSGNPVTSMPLTAGGTAKNLPDTDSYLNVYLNGGTYGGNGSTKEITGWYENNIASSVRDKIEDHMWPIGPVGTGNISTIENQANAYKWQGKIGLANAVDFVKASNSTSLDTATNYSSYLHIGSGSRWSMSSYSDSYSYNVWYGSGYSLYRLRKTYANVSYAVYPAFYLASCTTLTGSGTSSDKYRIVTDSSCVAESSVSLKITNTKTTNSITTTATSNDQIKKYEFQLDNGNWIDNGTNNTLQFTGLSSGTHTVSVRVTTNDDKVSKKTTSVTLDTIAKPTFANQINGENDADVTITYPSGCGSTLTCTYTKDNGSPVTVTSTTETVHFSAVGELVATVSDGTNTVSSTFTVRFDPQAMMLAQLNQTEVTSGDGLYDNGDGTYVFKGADPNNHIKLGDDNYRIMEIDEEGNLKVVRDTAFNSVWDQGSARYSSNSSDFCQSSYGCKSWGSNTTTLDSSGNNVTQMPWEAGGTLYNLPSEEAYLNVYLNGGTYNGTTYTAWYTTNIASTLQSKIVNHLWNIGPIGYYNSDFATDISQSEAYKWRGKVGLMTAIDYVKASTNPACTNLYQYFSNSSCNNNSTSHNYLFHSEWEWTLSALSLSFSSHSGRVWDVYPGGDLHMDYAYNSSAVRPVLYLSSDIQLSGTGGTGNNAYTIVG